LKRLVGLDRQLPFDAGRFFPHACSQKIGGTPS
jgi:hypothetical protein